MGSPKGGKGLSVAGGRVERRVPNTHPCTPKRNNIRLLPRPRSGFQCRALDLAAVGANDGDLAVALENRPLYLLEPLETSLVHRRKDLVGCDSLVAERFGNYLTVFHQHSWTRFHEAAKSS